jgi:hypothetical protein
MSKEQIRLVSLGIQSYGKIDKATKSEVVYPLDLTPDLQNLDPDGGVLIVFPEGYHVALFEADQGRGKTSAMTAIREGFGNIAAPGNAVNTIDNDKRFKYRVWGKDGIFYEIRGTKSTYVVEEIVTDENGEPKLNEKGKEIRKEPKRPQATILAALGPSGVDPNTLKEMKPAEQVAWIRSLYSLSTDALKLEVENNTKRKQAYDSRTVANNKHKLYTGFVEQSPLYARWKAGAAKLEEHFAQTIFDNVEKEVEEDQKKYQDYQRYETGLNTLRTNHENTGNEITRCKNEIEELEKKLALLKKEQEARVFENEKLHSRILEGEKWLEDHKKVVEDNNNAIKKIQDANTFRNERKEFNILVENKKQMDHWETESQRLTSIVLACDKWKKDFVKTFTPDIPEIEICIPDDDDKREGIFFRGATSEKWSESEAWEVASMIWEKLGIRIIFVENVTSLGSGAIEKLNHFANHGGYIFGTMMNRAEKNLKITISNQLPE